MASFEIRRIVGVLVERAGLHRVRLDDGSCAYNLSELTGPVRIGDDVVVNTTAVELGLGTGGSHVVHWNLSRSEPVTNNRPGQVMKARYTSTQTNVDAVEPRLLGGVERLTAIPVIVCSLHSQMGIAAAAFHRDAPTRRLAYVMTDGAALPIAISELVYELKARRVLCGTVTAGHAFGGDLEAVSLAGGLLAAHQILNADAIIVAMGPGAVGTGTKYGTTALEVVESLAWVRRLGGHPILALRVSDSDPRTRHEGLSHHSRTALEMLALDGAIDSVEIGVPTDYVLPDLKLDRARTTTVDVREIANLMDALGIQITTMGRDVRADPAFFRFAAAAGRVGARRLVGP